MTIMRAWVAVVLVSVSGCAVAVPTEPVGQALEAAGVCPAGQRAERLASAPKTPFDWDALQDCNAADDPTLTTFCCPWLAPAR